MRLIKKKSDILNLCVYTLSFAALIIVFLFATTRFTNPHFGWDISAKVDKYRILFGLYVLLMPVLYFMKIKQRQVLLFILSLMFSTIMVGKLSFIVYLGSLFYYLLIYVKIRTFVKLLIGAIVYIVFVLQVIKSFQYYRPSYLYIYMFVTLFPMRYLLFFHYNSSTNFKKEPVLNYINYIFFPAYLLIHPFIIIMPKYSSFKNSFSYGKNYIASLKSGVIYFCKGLAILLVLMTVDYFIENVFATSISRETVNDILSATYIIPYIWVISYILSCGYIILGLMHGVGCRIKSPFGKFALPMNIVDFYGRFLRHFKDYIVSIFYFPVFLLTKSWNTYASISISAIAAIMLAGICHRVLGLGFQFCSIMHYEGIDFVENSLELGLVQDGFFDKHLIIKIMYLLILSFIFAIQLMYNHASNYGAGKLAWIKNTKDSLVSKFLQLLIAMIVVRCIFL
ncbi:MAG: hypothetical protein K9L87_00160 [Candidatus Omnitrophica bacterium]|nr:hypothetical protein [Candidatus Omnitrophota bacterium]MCF7876735.1 hypothetical protein [Candidatus Omnitrophota bacterium]MCF7891468.1 hypothetical protein [Candidatus Omnitrophota bacterium]MCF7895404.1 hypothetical protein [Candidatus Omnitrophota bacterium]MCF7897160.1 hypothetical protein [Candidatus Omnitrophota bacterium]